MIILSVLLFINTFLANQKFSHCNKSLNVLLIDFGYILFEMIVLSRQTEVI